MYKRERERQKRDTRGLDLDLTSERLRSGFEGLTSICSPGHHRNLSAVVGTVRN